MLLLVIETNKYIKESIEYPPDMLLKRINNSTLFKKMLLEVGTWDQCLDDFAMSTIACLKC